MADPLRMEEVDLTKYSFFPENRLLQHPEASRSGLHTLGVSSRKLESSREGYL